MSAFFARARFGVVFFIAMMLWPSAQVMAADLSAKVLILSRILTYNSSFTAFQPVQALGGDGNYTFTVSPALPAGINLNASTGAISGLPSQPTDAATYTMTVTDGTGASATGDFSLVVNRATVTISLSASPITVNAGESITFTATVTPAAATGKVTFRLSASVSQQVDLVNGVATLTSADLPYGATTGVTATYSGDDYYQSRAASTSVTVNTTTTAVSLRASASSAPSGQAITFTATITPSGVPGSITFLDSGNVLGSAVISNGVATFSTSTLSVGNHSIVARYPDTDVWSASESNAVSVTITAANLKATTTSLQADKTSVAPGESATLTASVAPASAGTTQATPTGNVTFRNNGAKLETKALVNGVATITYALSASGSFDAVYEGDSTYASSTSGVTSISVVTTQKITPKLTLGSPRTSYLEGDNVTFNLSIDPGEATGTISFYDGSMIMGTATLSSGKASFSTSQLKIGTHTIQATYDGNATTYSGSSNTLSITIGAGTSKITTSTALVPSATKVDTGGTVTFTVSVSPSTATGQVNLMDNGSTVDSATLTGGKVQFTRTGLTTGTHVFNAVYQGSSTHYSSTSSNVSVQAGKATATLTLSASPTKAAVGQTVTLTARIQPTSATGTISFKDGTTDLGTATLSSGVATLRTTFALGSHSITASFAGNTSFTSATSSAVTVSVQGDIVQPGDDKNARAIAASQMATISRNATLHISGLHMRMETLHEDDVPAVVNNINFSQPGQMPSDVRAYEDDPWIRGSVMPESKAAQQIEGVFGRPGTVLGAPSAKDALAVSGNKEGTTQLGQSFNMWTSGTVMFGGTTVTSLGTATQSKFSLQAVMLGMDTRLTDKIHLGVAFSYSSDTNNLGSDGTKASSSTMSGSLYSSFKLNQNIFVDSSLGYGSLNFKSTRFDTGSSGLFSGSRSGKMLMGSLALSYDRKFGALKIAPYVRGEIASATLDAYTEQGDVASALVYSAQQVSTQNVTLGLRSQYDIERSWGVISPNTRLEYRRTMGGSMMQPIAYAADPSTSYVLSSTSLPTDMITANFGVTLRDKKQLSGSIDYIVSGAQGGVQGQGLRGAVNKSF